MKKAFYFWINIEGNKDNTQEALRQGGVVGKYAVDGYPWTSLGPQTCLFNHILGNT